MESEQDKFIKNRLEVSVNITGIYTVHYFRYGKNFRFKGESHNFWELVYIDSGNATVVADGEEFFLRQGDAFIHRPNERHTIFTTDDFANSAIITFECKSRALKYLTRKIYTLSDNEKTLLNRIIYEAKDSFRDKLNDIYLLKMTKNELAPFGGEQFIKNCAELIILSLIRKERNNENRITNSLISANSDKITDAVTELLKEKIKIVQEVNLDEISFKLGFSKSYIKAQFKKSTGYSVIQYFINLKINRAKELLSQQKYTVSEIADLLGFGSIYYFSRLFKTHTDMSPTEYVNSIKADNLL